MAPNPNLKFEKGLWPTYPFIAGLDEAGRGALAGPVCVGAVILPNDNSHLSSTLNGVRDSKLLTPIKRDALTPRIKATALTWSVAFASAKEIDTLGIVPATRLAAMRAIELLTLFPDYLLTDFRLEVPELDIPQTAIVKGDQKSLSIAAASILAKTARDEVMRGLESQYPNYGLGKHKGYGTQAHRQALKSIGFSSIHRKTFRVK
ncbi:MAG: ribonuclease HII [Anaerolineales bacterium]|nr:ribonuclease HII [Anaerolineales bacterium]